MLLNSQIATYLKFLGKEEVNVIINQRTTFETLDRQFFLLKKILFEN